MKSLALLTDLYQLTMAYGYFQNKMHGYDSVFHLTFRNHPFKGNYTIACGLHSVIKYLQEFKFTTEDIDYLATLRGNNNRLLFDDKFLDYLQSMNFSCNIDAVPEGMAVFPHEPIVRVQGPLIQCQLIETALLNIINFETLISTKASRVCQAAMGDPVLEFGLRRAQGIDGAITASRAAYVGGCAGTSNVLAGKLFDIPVKGTHAHSWVMCFEDELEAFEKYADALPNNCVLLVDTYNTEEGIYKAVKVGHQLQDKGYKLAGIRLDSGDLLSLSQQARNILDSANLHDTAIIASNDLDEHSIKDLKSNGAKIDTWGVGTKLITAYDQPALGGVYKLSAIHKPRENWRYTIKLSEQANKISDPGVLQVRRFFDENSNPVRDILFNTHKFDTNTQQENENSVLLLKPVFVEGCCVYTNPPLKDIRKCALRNAEIFSHLTQYPVNIDLDLITLKLEIIEKISSPKLRTIKSATNNQAISNT